MEEYEWNACGCCVNPTERMVYKSSQYRLIVRTAFKDGYWFEGVSFMQFTEDVGGFSWSPCNIPNRPRHASQIDAEEYAIQRVLDTERDFSPILCNALKKLIQNQKQLKLF